MASGAAVATPAAPPRRRRLTTECRVVRTQDHAFLLRAAGAVGRGGVFRLAPHRVPDAEERFREELRGHAPRLAVDETLCEARNAREYAAVIDGRQEQLLERERLLNKIRRLTAEDLDSATVAAESVRVATLQARVDVLLETVRIARKYLDDEDRRLLRRLGVLFTQEARASP
ncbi:hypothetical protein HK405_013351, partial [Cladochytrium tenue]